MNSCPACGNAVNQDTRICPNCGHGINTRENLQPNPMWRGFEYKSKTKIYGWPLIHIAFGRNKYTGKLLAAKGIIAIGQFGFGLITFAQFGVGLLFGFGQFIFGTIAVAQFAIAVYFGLGQMATGITAIGQLAFGKYVLAQIGLGKYVWSEKIQNPEAVQYFKTLWAGVKNFMGM